MIDPATRLLECKTLPRAINQALARLLEKIEGFHKGSDARMDAVHVYRELVDYGAALRTEETNARRELFTEIAPPPGQSPLAPLTMEQIQEFLDLPTPSELPARGETAGDRQRKILCDVFGPARADAAPRSARSSVRP